MNDDQAMSMVMKSISEDISVLNQRIDYIEFVLSQLLTGLEEIGIISSDPPEGAGSLQPDENQVEIPFPTQE